MKSAIGNRQSASRVDGFTLLELLIALGIILILIGVAIPLVGKIRRQAQAANTRQMLARIEAGLQQYFEEFKSYPGAFAHPQLKPYATSHVYRDPPNTADPLQLVLSTGTSAANPLTSTESLYVALVGGLQYTPAGTPAFAVKESIYTNANGPLSLSAANIKKYPSYISVAQDETTYKVLNAASSIPTPGQWNAGAAGFAGDTEVPEFVDKFTNAKPILYMRATRGAAGFIDLGSGYNAAVQYDVDQITYTYSNGHSTGGVSAYGKPWPISEDMGEFNTDFPANGPYSAGFESYFGNPSSSTATPYQKDGYILISAGPDGKYGTADDITNFRNQ